MDPSFSCVAGRHLPGFEGYKCSECGTVSSTYRGFEKHMGTRHKIGLSGQGLLSGICPTDTSVHTRHQTVS